MYKLHFVLGYVLKESTLCHAGHSDQHRHSEAAQHAQWCCHAVPQDDHRGQYWLHSLWSVITVSGTICTLCCQAPPSGNHSGEHSVLRCRDSTLHGAGTLMGDQKYHPTDCIGVFYWHWINWLIQDGRSSVAQQPFMKPYKLLKMENEYLTVSRWAELSKFVFHKQVGNRESYFGLKGWRKRESAYDL